MSEISVELFDSRKNILSINANGIVQSILRRTVDGIGILRAVLWPQLAEADAVVLDISPCLIP